MKLLFDHNISPGLVERLGDLFPGSKHVLDVGLERALDSVVWRFAHDNDFVIVTKGSDFVDLSVFTPEPAKVIWIRLGNCSTHEIHHAIRAAQVQIMEFAEQQANSVLLIG